MHRERSLQWSDFHPPWPSCSRPVWPRQYPHARRTLTPGKPCFARFCSACHATAAGKTFVGPSLFGVVGRKSGSLAGYQFSDGMRAAALTWDNATLDRYIAAPREIVPGTKMAFGGMKDTQKRHDLIAYLDTIK